MPSQALLLKQYFSGASACQICDKVDAISSLGHAPVFRALNAPCDGEMISHDLPGAKPLSFWRFRNRKGIVAEGDERLEDGAEVCASGGGEQPGDVMNRNQLCVVPPKSSETEQKSPVSLHIIFGFSQARTATQSTPYPVPNEMPLEDQDELSLSPKQLAWPRYLLWRRPQW